MTESIQELPKIKNRNFKEGLKDSEVEAYQKAGLVNISVKTPTRTVREIVISNVFTYFNFVFIVMAALLIFVGSYRDLTFLPIIIANTLIGIFQEIRAKLVLDDLVILNSPTSIVVRNGEEKEVNSEMLVQDDVVIFKAGDQICADAVVLDGEIAVNEALLTGESDNIKKTAKSELLSGSFVVSGKCYARLTHVGAESYISKLTLEARKEKHKEQSQIIRSLNHIITLAGIVIIPIGEILFYQQYILEGTELQKSVQSMIGSIIGLIPEGLFLLASVNLALSAMRLARKKVMLHDMKCIETLARVNILCVDKTGTITSDKMEVSDYVLLDKQKYTKEQLFTQMSNFAAAQEADNITMETIKGYFSEPQTRGANSVVGFSSEFKYSGVNFEDGSYILGAPEFVLREDYAKYQTEIEEYSKKGYRVMVFGEYAGILDGRKLQNQVNPIGLILITNAIRETAAETFRYFAEQNVEIKVISGDNPITVSEVAKKAKIKNAQKYIDASTLETEESMIDALRKYTVFGRVTPEQKRKFVKIMQGDGNIVAMTGDGVNDVLALRDADCSIAMASGSEAAVQAAQLVLLDSDFARMPEVVSEGRQVVNNLERTGSLFLVKNIFTLITSIIVIIWKYSYPLVPAQVSLISLFTIGIPAFLLSQSPTRDLIHGSFVRNTLAKSIPGGICDALAISLMIWLGMIFNLTESDISTAAAFLVAVIGIIMVYRAARPFNLYKKIIVIGCCLGLILSYILLPDFFGMTRISIPGAILCLTVALLVIPILFLSIKLTEYLFKIYDGWILKQKQRLLKIKELGKR